MKLRNKWLSDVVNAFGSLRENDEIIQLYVSGYVDQAKQSRDISEYAIPARRGKSSGFSGFRAELPLEPTCRTGRRSRVI